MHEVFFNHSPYYFLRQDLFLILELTNSDSLTGQRAPEILFSTLPLHWDYRYLIFHVDTGIQNSGPLVCLFQ